MSVPFNAKKLATAVNNGYKGLEPFRASTAWNLEQFAGPRYGKDPKKLAKTKAAIVNLMHQAVAVLIPNLVLVNPKTDALSRRVALAQHVKKLALAVDMVTEEQNLASVYELCGQAAILGPMGTARLFVRQGVETVKTEWGDTPCTTVGVDPIDIWDYFCDVDAKRLEIARLDGHRWAGSHEILKNSGYFDNEALAKIKPRGTNDSADARIAQSEADRWDFMETLPLVDVVLYGHDSTRVVTLAGCDGEDGNIADPAGIVVNNYEFDGLERGPYRHLFFTQLIGDNPMPLPPADVWGDLHDNMLKIARKIVAQILRTKRITATQRGQGGDDLDAIRVAADGEHLELDHPEKCVTIEQGGVSKELYEGVAWLMQEFNNASANVSLLGGTPGADEESATKTSILQSNGSRRMEYMQGKAFKFAGAVAEGIAFYLDTDPLLQALPIPIRPQGGEQIEVEFRPQGPNTWWPGKYQFNIKQYSMVPMDPAVRTRRIIEILQTIPTLMPMEQLYPGVTSRALEVLAETTGSEKLAEVLQDPQMMANQEALLAAIPPQMPGMVGGAAGGGAGTAIPGPGGANPQLNQTRSAMAPSQVGV